MSTMMSRETQFSMVLANHHGKDTFIAAQESTTTIPNHTHGASCGWGEQSDRKERRMVFRRLQLQTVFWITHEMDVKFID